MGHFFDKGYAGRREEYDNRSKSHQKNYTAMLLVWKGKKWAIVWFPGVPRLFLIMFLRALLAISINARNDRGSVERLGAFVFVCGLQTVIN